MAGRQAGRQAGDLPHKKQRFKGDTGVVSIAMHDEQIDEKGLRSPFPYFGGKSRAAGLIWPRLGAVPNYVEPFMGSAAVLLARPDDPRVETVNDLNASLCLAPESLVWCSDLRWRPIGDLSVGDEVIGFDEHNGPARQHGLHAPTRYRHWKLATVTRTRRVLKPCYRLTFSDGTVVVASADHQWLVGSHVTGGRGWRWATTNGLVANRANQRSWVLKLAPVVEQEQSWESGWLAGFFDGEGHLNGAAGFGFSVTQKTGPEADLAERLLRARGFDVRVDRKKPSSPHHKEQVTICINGGMREAFRFLMLVRPQRLIEQLRNKLPRASLYGRSHQAVSLVQKENIGEQEVVALETTSGTYVAEGLASHNCNFWRALKHDPDGVAFHCDDPVNETDLHARHRWLVEQGTAIAHRCIVDPDFYDVKIAGWWVWGQCLWIGSGWCQPAELRTDGQPREKLPTLKSSDGVAGRRWQGGGQGGGSGVHALTLTRQKPVLRGDAGATGIGITATPLIQSGGLYDYLRELSARLRRVRVCCGDWKRVLTPSVTTYIGVTGVLLDPPYSHAMRARCYAEDHDISADVRAWAIEHGDDPNFRIALCGYDDEHGPHMPDTWECVAWKAHGGYSRTERGVANRDRERIWFSPHCLRAELPLFEALEAD